MTFDFQSQALVAQLVTRLADLSPIDLQRQFPAAKIEDPTAFAAQLQAFVLQSALEPLGTNPQPAASPPAESKEGALGAGGNGVIAETGIEQSMRRDAEALRSPVTWTPRPVDLELGEIAKQQVLNNVMNVDVDQYAAYALKTVEEVRDDIKAGLLLVLRDSDGVERVPVWQLDEKVSNLTRTVLLITYDIDSWTVYFALVEPLEALGGRSPIEVVRKTPVPVVAVAVLNVLGITQPQRPEAA